MINTWNINSMRRNDADGGVILVNWSCVVSDTTGVYSSSVYGDLHCEPDSSSEDYIPYEELTKDEVLNWVYASLAAKSRYIVEESSDWAEESDILETPQETPQQAKVRIEVDRADKVQDQIDRARGVSDGVPWPTYIN